MCGICGELSFDRDRGVRREALAAMTGAIAHRGPDAEDAFVAPDGRAGLGFRRLSIIDLRAIANQPMANEDGSIHLVFNGEIYNFRDLRPGLVARGHVFRSNADSEVILHLYEERGDEVVDALDGMFAFALWDARAGRLLLARDRAGKKPLFVYEDRTRLAFASEIKALLAHPDLSIEPDEDAFPEYFLYGYVPHPRTFYRNVRHLEPGSVAVIQRDGARQTRRYWRLEYPQAARHAPVSRDAASTEVRRLLTAAVERRLMSDVPLGAFLSGGIDSTVVVGLMARLMKEPVKTFSIGFENQPQFDETAIARRTAERFGTAHTEFRVSPSAIDLLPTLVWHHDGPFADSSAIPTYLVAKLTRAHVTVALNGDGGDEVFAGYLRFGAALAADRIPAAAARAASFASDWLTGSPHERHWGARVRRFTRFMQLPLDDRITAWAGVFFDDVDRLLEGRAYAHGAVVDRRSHLRDLAATLDGLSPLSRLLAANFHSYLHDDLLVKADRMTMANSLEARSPFLDTALVEYVATLPDALKTRGTKTKIVLREAFADLLPAEVAGAPKRGFGVPLDAWFRGELRDYVNDTLLSPSARASRYVSTAYVRELIDAHLAGRANHGHRIWTLLTFENWLQQLPAWRTAGSGTGVRFVAPAAGGL